MISIQTLCIHKTELGQVKMVLPENASINYPLPKFYYLYNYYSWES